MRQDRIAVRRGFRHQRGAERAAGAGAVFDHDGLTELGGETVEHQPRHDVGRASRAERNRRLDQMRRPVFGACGRRGEQAQQNDLDSNNSTHRGSRFFVTKRTRRAARTIPITRPA